MTRIRKFLNLILVFLLAAALSLTASHYYAKFSARNAREDAGYLANIQKYRIQATVNEFLSDLTVLEKMVRDSQGTIRDFQSTAEELVGESSYPEAIQSLKLAPDGIVSDVYPAGNGTTGENLFESADQERVSYARNTGMMISANPVSLSGQTYVMTVYRPIYLDNEDDGKAFWGFAVESLLLPQALLSADLNSLISQGYVYTLWQNDSVNKEQIVIDTSALAPMSDPVTTSLAVPGKVWYFSIARQGGWYDRSRIINSLILSLLIGFLASLLYYLIGSYRSRKNYDRRSEQIRQILNHINSGVLVYEQDGQGHFRYFFANKPFFQMTGTTDDQLRSISPGRMAADLFSLSDTQLNTYRKELIKEGRMSRELTLKNFSRGESFWAYVVLSYYKPSSSRPLILASVTDKEEERRAIAASQHDSMTGLYNKATAITKIDRIIVAGGIFYMVDIDKFKSVNDQFGHKVGDKCIMIVARTLKKHFRGSDIVARFGGDEFMIFMPTDRVNEDFALQKADRFRARIQLDAEAYDVTVSVGALLVRAGESITCARAIEKADKALYTSKNSGRNRVTIYREAEGSETARQE